MNHQLIVVYYGKSTTFRGEIHKKKYRDSWWEFPIDGLRVQMASNGTLSCGARCRGAATTTLAIEKWENC